MIDVSDDARSVLGGSFSYFISVQSWLGDQLLSDAVPVSAGQEETDRSLRVPERVTLTVPRVDDEGVDWTPTADDSPLAANGQTLKISLGVGIGQGRIEWFQRGEFLIQETEEDVDGQTLTVTAVGLLALIDEANFIAPFQPSGTIGSTARDLLEPAVPVNLDGAPVDRSVPVSAVNWDSDRLQAFLDLLDAWPAVSRMNEGGYLEILPDTTPTAADAVRSFTDRPGGTMVTAAGTSSRDGGFNTVVATGYAADGTEVRAVAYTTVGPWSYPAGQANPLPVPFGYSSPLLTTQAQCLAAASTVLARKQREAVKRRYTITAVPDPTLQDGDPILVTNDVVTDLLCTVEAMKLPYFAAGGAMEVTAVSVA
jgi:hypothetical protein